MSEEDNRSLYNSQKGRNDYSPGSAAGSAIGSKKKDYYSIRNLLEESRHLINEDSRNKCDYHDRSYTETLALMK